MSLAGNCLLGIVSTSFYQVGTDPAGGHTADDGAWWYVSSDDGAGCNDGLHANRDAGQDYASSAEPRAVLDDHILVNPWSCRVRSLWVDTMCARTKIGPGGDINCATDTYPRACAEEDIVATPSVISNFQDARTKDGDRGADTDVVSQFSARHPQQPHLCLEQTCLRDETEQELNEIKNRGAHERHSTHWRKAALVPAYGRSHLRYGA
jgi:hypothetical protein